MSNRNCLAYWFPKLQAAGVPVPRTEIVRTDCDLAQLLDGKDPEGWSAFLAQMYAAIARIGGTPCFLRTGQGSGKHQWENTCHVTEPDLLPRHVAALVEWSHLVDFMGLAHDVWAIREMLPVEPIAALPRYGNMPLVTEVRSFVKGGAILCSHPYWPEGAVADGFHCTHGMSVVGFGEDMEERCSRCAADAGVLYERTKKLTVNDMLEVAGLVGQVAHAFADDGAWSVDVLKTTRGWFVTDMADAAMSYHEPGCERAREIQGRPSEAK